VNDFCFAASPRVQRAGHKPLREGRRDSSPPTNKENTMLRTFAAVLVATTLVAGTAFAAETAGTAGTNSVTQAATAKTTPAAKHAKMVKHTHKSTRKHVAKAGKTHQAKVSKAAKHADGGRSRA
jgi:hypothetical protein